MILGTALTPTYLIIGGLTMATLLIIQVLIGLRVIHFKGALHLRVHKTFAFVLLGAAALHGTAALTYFQGWKILS